MSGMEVAGLAVSLLPIILSTVNNYQSLCSRPFSRYSSFSREVECYLTRLDNQQVIFRGICFHLLSDVIETDNAELMLADLSHDCWFDDGLEHQLAILLGESRKQCIRTLWQIERILNDFEDERLGFSQALDEDEVRSPQAL